MRQSTKKTINLLNAQKYITRTQLSKIYKYHMIFLNIGFIVIHLYKELKKIYFCDDTALKGMLFKILD